MALNRVRRGNEYSQRKQINTILGQVETQFSGVGTNIGELNEEIEESLEEVYAAMSKRGAYAELETINGTSPAQEEITDAFGSPSDVGEGFNGWLKVGADKCFAVVTDGEYWYCTAVVNKAAFLPTTTTSTGA